LSGPFSAYNPMVRSKLRQATLCVYVTSWVVANADKRDRLSNEIDTRENLLATPHQSSAAAVVEDRNASNSPRPIRDRFIGEDGS
jgi:hypothetical protein